MLGLRAGKAARKVGRKCFRHRNSTRASSTLALASKPCACVRRMEVEGGGKEGGRWLSGHISGRAYACQHGFSPVRACGCECKGAARGRIG